MFCHFANKLRTSFGHGSVEPYSFRNWRRLTSSSRNSLVNAMGQGDWPFDEVGVLWNNGWQRSNCEVWPKTLSYSTLQGISHWVKNIPISGSTPPLVVEHRPPLEFAVLSYFFQLFPTIFYQNGPLRPLWTWNSRGQSSYWNCCHHLLMLPLKSTLQYFIWGGHTMICRNVYWEFSLWGYFLSFVSLVACPLIIIEVVLGSRRSTYTATVLFIVGSTTRHSPPPPFVSLYSSSARGTS